MAWELYEDQKECVKACVNYIQSGDIAPGVVVCPTGWGKSLVISEIAKQIGEGIIVLHLTSDLLEQNLEKLEELEISATVYSASLKQKNLSDMVFATLGSVQKIGDLVRQHGIKTVIVDECDRNFGYKKSSMFMRFISALKPKSVIGFTATPWYLTSSANGSELTMINKRYFKKFIYVNQIQPLIAGGRWTPCEYELYTFDESKLVVNTLGSDYTDESIQRVNAEFKVNRNIAVRIKSLLAEGVGSILVFVDCKENCGKFSDWLECSAELTDETPAKERRQIIKDFKSGKIKVLFNYGILGIGFNYPGLEAIIMGRSTMSLSLVYQIFGRGVRTLPGKKKFRFIDFGGNIHRFGRLEDLVIENYPGIGWCVTMNGIVMSGVPIGTKYTREQVASINTTAQVKEPISKDITFHFGKHKDVHLNKVPLHYLKWWAKEVSKNNIMDAKERLLFDEVNKVIRNKTKFK